MNQNRILIVKEKDYQVVKQILENHRIKLIDSDEDIIINKTIQIESRLNKSKGKTRNYAISEHDRLRKFATQLGCKDISEAIKECGGGIQFKRRFKKEFVP